MTAPAGGRFAVCHRCGFVGPARATDAAAEQDRIEHRREHDAAKDPRAVARGSVRSAVKTAAARVNGRRGGRPAHRPVVFVTTDYRRATGRAPRGTGSWHFAAVGASSGAFVFDGQYSIAVRFARVHFGTVGTGAIRVTVADLTGNA